MKTSLTILASVPAFPSVAFAGNEWTYQAKVFEDATSSHSVFYSDWMVMVLLLSIALCSWGEVPAGSGSFPAAGSCNTNYWLD